MPDVAATSFGVLNYSGMLFNKGNTRTPFSTMIANRAKQTNHVDRIAVLETRIVRYAVEADNDVLVVRLSSRITDYTTDDRTGNIVSGSTSRELFMVYDWKLIRQKDKKTLNQPSVTQISCPNCGAPLDINHTGKCPYCGTIVTLSDHDWALSVIKGISQRTVGN